MYTIVLNPSGDYTNPVLSKGEWHEEENKYIGWIVSIVQHDVYGEATQYFYDEEESIYQILN